ncbi:DUF1488 family protein [Roseomonas sp. BN140053]|uniref:DUF1488 family protein n=1 Tax=Roseomonas sp. BN140053 TaxID=3391898 RepID=UPI0039E7F64E
MMLYSARSLLPFCARWAERRVFFEIFVNGHAMPCAISGAALEEIAKHRHVTARDALACFEQSRDRIEAVARKKAHRRAEGASGLLNLWTGDLDEPPPEGAPMMAFAVEQQRAA